MDKPADSWSLMYRRHILDQRHDRVGALLRVMYSACHAADIWRDLRFRSVDHAVQWALGWFAHSDSHPSYIGLSPAEAPVDDVLFACTRFWALVRMRQLQLADRDDAPRIDGRGRREVMHTELVARAPAIEPWEPVELAGHLANVAREHAVADRLEELVERLLHTLTALGQSVHRHEEILWLCAHTRLRRVLACQYDADALPTTPLPAELSGQSSASRSKATALALLRFLLLYGELVAVAGPQHEQLDDAAFFEMYMRSVDPPGWPALPRDRWDVVPKRVVAARLKARGFAVKRQEAARVARRGLASRISATMVEWRIVAGDAQTEHDVGRVSEKRAVERMLAALDLVMAMDSIRPTLRDEYARGSGSRHLSPSATAIGRWRDELAEAVRALLNDIEEERV